MRFKFNTLFNKALVAICIALFPPLLSFVFSYRASEENLRNRLLDDLAMIADAHENYVFQFLEGLKIRTVDFSSDGYIRERLPEAVRGNRAVREALAAHLRRHKLPVDRALDGITLTGPDGTIVASTDRTAPRASLSASDAFVNATQGGPSLSAAGPWILASAPVRRVSNGVLLGVVINRFSIKDLQDLLSGAISRHAGALSWDAGRPKSMRIYLVSQDRVMMSEAETAVGGQGPVIDTLPVTSCLSEKREVRAFYPDYRGVEVAGASMCFPRFRWTLVVETDADEVFAPPLRAIRRNTLIATVAVLSVLGGLFVLFSRTILDPLRRMAAATARIAGGERGVSVVVTSRDEVGSLASAFNDMAAEIANRTDQLRSSEEKYRTILDNINEIIYRLRIEGGGMQERLEFVSAQCRPITGYGPEEFIHDPGLWLRLIHPEDVPALAQATEAVIRSRKSGTRVYRLRPKDRDDYLWIEDKMVPETDAGGAVVACWGVARDVTERRRSEEQLRLKEEAIASSINAMALTDLDGTLVYVNRAFLRMWRYDAEGEVLGTPLVDLWQDRNRAREILRNLVERGLWRGELTGTRRDGSVVEVQLASNAVAGEEGRPGRLLVSCIDITERKQTERALAVNASRLAAAQRIARLGTWEWDVGTNELWWSDQIYQIFDLRPREFPATYEAFLERVHPEDRDVVQAAVDSSLAHSTPYDIDHRIVLPDGRIRYVHEQGTVHADATGKAVRMTGTVQDITARKRMEDSVRESEQRFRGIFNGVYDGILVADVETQGFILANARICAMLGYTLNEIAQLGVKDIHPPEDVQRLAEQFRSMAQGDMTLVRDVRVKRKDGSLFSADIAGSPIMLEGRPRLIGIFRDTTEQKKAEAELRKLSAAIEHSVNVVFITDRAGSIEYVNPTFERVTGWTKEEAVGKSPGILASGDTPPEEYDKLWKTILSGKTWRSEYRNKRKDGSLYWASSVITPIRDAQGEITHFLAVQEDISERKTADERLKYLAAYDELTGLINRGRFMELIETWLHAYEMSGSGTGMLLLIDVDEFKYINDTYGHTSGDDILKLIAGLFKRKIDELGAKYSGASDALLSRMGGDEFAVFLPNMGVPDGRIFAEKLREAAESFLPLEGNLRITVSIGMAAYPEHGGTVKELLTKVDAALHRTKRTAKNRVHLYRPEDQDLEHIHTRLHQKESILKAIAEDRFLPWFQPIRDLQTGRVHHYEALARMRDEKGTILFPGDFIETAEMFGLIGAIDRVISRKTMLAQTAAARRGVPLTFGMNLSGRDLGDEELLNYLKRSIEETGAEPSHLVFEITETAAVHDLDRAKHFIDSLKKTGCRFSLDDFGVGFTSFVYLRELGVDYVKIDGSFVRMLRTNRNDRLFVKAITDVARGMDIKTVAEFVEDEETLAYLREYGVDFAQGYLIGKPSPNLLS